VTTDTLLRGLRRWDLVGLVINSIIGAGIFGLPSRAFAIAGPSSLFAYVAAAVAMSLIILCFAEVGSRFTVTGGPYLYARETFGPLIGFQVGWLMWLGRIAAFAALCNLFVGYFAYFVPIVSSPGGRWVVVIAVTMILAWLNVRGLRVSATVTNVLTVGKLVPLLLVGLIGLFFIDADRFSVTTLPTYRAFSQAALLLVFTFTGFEGASIPTGETREPSRNLPFALLIGLGVVTATYMLVHIVCMGTVPSLATSERPVSDASVVFLGSAGASIVAAGALISIGGTLNALMFATPRLLFAMSANRQGPRALARSHATLRTPATAIVVTAILTLLATLSSTFLSALTISAVVRLMAYAATCAALPVLRRRRPGAAFEVPAGVAVAMIALALILWLLSNTPLHELRLAIIAVIVGLAVFAAGERRWR
jgi:APA family basic amino acid/polyamine antiporter